MNLCDVHFLGNQCISAERDAGLKYQFHKPIGKKELLSRTARLMIEKKKWFDLEMEFLSKFC